MTKKFTPKAGERTATTETVNTLLKNDSEVTEKRTKRLSLIAAPSIWADFQLLAASKGTSPNDLFNQLITEAVNDNKERIEKQKELIRG